MAKEPAPMWTKEGRQNPTAWYRYMRENHPVTFHKDINAYGVFRYDDCCKVFQDDVNWSVARRFDKLPDDEKDLHILANTVNGIDPPDHFRVRRLAMPALAPNKIAGLTPQVKAMSKRLLDEALPKGEFDFVAEYAHRLPQMVINQILGIPPEDYQKAKALSDRMEAGGGRYTGAPNTNAEDLKAVNREYREYFEPIIEARRKKDYGDVMSSLVQAEMEGDKLSPKELFKMAMIFNRGGGETTMTGITQMIRAMMEFPDQYRRVQEDRSLIPTTVEEALRYYPPSHSMSRVATRDVKIGGLTVPEGATMLMWMPSANRDPDVFPDPDKFDVGRKPNRHLSLGLGIHVCIGMHLARLEMQVALEDWMDRVATFRRTEDGPIDWTQQSLVAVTPRSFPLKITQRAA